MLNMLSRCILLIAIVAFSLQSCESVDPTKNSSRLRLKLTDAPLMVVPLDNDSSMVIKEVFVDIHAISVFLVDKMSREGEWFDLSFSGYAYDILKLMNGKTVQLLDQYVPAGTLLTEVKLVFGNDSRLVTDTDESIPLQIPSELLDGLVIKAENMDINTNTIYSMIIDINTAFSIQSKEGNYFLVPEIRAFPETFGGKLRGYVKPINANPLVMITQDTDTLFALPFRENSNDDMGMFYFMGLRKGDWKVHLYPNPETNYKDTVFISTIEDGKTIEINPKPITLKPLDVE